MFKSRKWRLEVQVTLDWKVWGLGLLVNADTKALGAMLGPVSLVVGL